MPAHHDSLELLLEHQGTLLLRYKPSDLVPVAQPPVATEPPLPADVASNDELFLNGLHLEQYRHPTRAPEAYWLEAIRRDPGDSRALHAMGRWHMRRGEFQRAETYLCASIARLTLRNPNPYDGEPHYNLGLTLLALGRPAEAYDALYKSTWNAAWRGPAYHRLAELDCSRGEWATATDHLERSLRAEADNLNARMLLTIALRGTGRPSEADASLRATCALDPLDVCSRWLMSGLVPEDGQRRLDLALDLSRSGLLDAALTVLEAPLEEKNDGSGAMLLYLRADLLARVGHLQESVAAFRNAASASTDYVFPSRLEELLLLERAITANAEDPRAPYFLGNLLYDRRRYDEAIALWERATELDPEFPTAWRNLGFAYFNVRHDRRQAMEAFTRARALAPGDARILYEQDQLQKRTGVPIEKRLAVLESERKLVAVRDDLSVELATLYNSTRQPAKALEILNSRQFGPWEGGEGLVLGQYVRANVLLAQEALAAGDAQNARAHLDAAWHPPRTLSEAAHLLVNGSMIDYWSGLACVAAGDEARAHAHWERAARQRSDFQGMQVQPVSEMTYWSALALQRLGRDEEAKALLERIGAYGRDLEQVTPQIDYFATSLPAMLLFEEDLKERQTISAKFLQAQALLGASETSTGMTLLDEVRRLDTSHAAALDLATMLGAT